jgi:hypothetical protein
VSASLGSALGSEADSSPIPNRCRLKSCWFENDERADRLDFGLVTDRDTVEQAFHLQQDQYVSQGHKRLRRERQTGLRRVSRQASICRRILHFVVGL